MNRVVRSVGELGLKVARWEVVWRSGLRKKRAKEKKPKDNNQKQVDRGTMLVNRGSAADEK
jgi:predicted alpha/beta-hydrolase family hydrolase